MFISIDGDNIGKKLEKFIFLGDIHGLNKFSCTISTKVQSLSTLITELGGEVHIAAGDNLLASISEHSSDKVLLSVKKINTQEFAFSVGFSQDIKACYLALKYAKTLGSRHFVQATLNGQKIEYVVVE